MNTLIQSINFELRVKKIDTFTKSHKHKKLIHGCDTFAISWLFLLRFMCKKFHFCVLSFSLFFGSLANANNHFCWQNNCSKKLLSPLLIDLDLKPTIRNNGNLIANLQIEYGQSFVDDLIVKNPFLMKKPEEKIDVETLEWVKNVSFTETFSPGIKYILAPFSTKENYFGMNVFLEAFISGLYPTFKQRAVFLSVEQLNALESLFIYDNFSKPLEYLKKAYLLSKTQALEVIKNIHNEIFKKKNYILPSDIKKINNHTLIIIAHGAPGSEFISEMKVEIHFSELAELLKDIGIPNDVNIEIGSCSSGLGIDRNNSNKTKNKLIELFINREISEVAGDVTNSFAYKLAKELYATLPQFNGYVTGYIGLVHTFSSASFMRNPKKPNEVITEKIPAISLYDVNNKPVAFDKSEMAVEYKRNDFP